MPHHILTNQVYATTEDVIYRHPLDVDDFYNITTHHHSCPERPDIVFMSVKMETVWSATFNKVQFPHQHDP